MPLRWRNLLAFVVLAAAPLVLLWPCLAGDRAFLPFDLAQFPPASVALDAEQLAAIRGQPAHYDTSELPALVIPELELAAGELDAGRFPSWNPYARFGAPLFGNSLAAMVYPPNWWLLVRHDPVPGLALGAYLGFVVAGVLAFAFLRAIRLSESAALFGAIAFAFCGTLAANAHFYMRFNALVWLPGMLLGCLRLAQTQGRERVPAWLGLAAAMAMTWLAGFPPFAVASILVAALYGGVLVLRLGHREGGRPALDLAAALLTAAAVGTAAAAIQLAPMLAFLPESNRHLTPSVEALNSQGFASMGLLGYVLPDAFGHPNGPALGERVPGWLDWLRYGEPRRGLPTYAESPLALLWTDRRSWQDGRLFFPHGYNFTEYALFPGTLPLLLAAVGALSPGPRFRRPALWLAAALLVLAVAPRWLRWLYHLPGFSSIPPVRYTGPLCVLVAVLAAMGHDAIGRRAPRRLVPAVAGFALLGAVACAAIALGEPWHDPDALLDAIVARYREHVPDLDAAAARQWVQGGGGVDNLGAAGPRLAANLWRAAVALACGGAFLLLWHRLRGRRVAMRWLGIAATALTFAELALLAGPLTRGRTLPVPTDTAVHTFLREQRLAALDRGGITVARAAKAPKAPIDLPAGTLFPERIRDLNAYAFVDGRSHRLFLALYGAEVMMRDIWPRAFPDDERLQRPLFDLLGLRFVLSSEPLEHAGTPIGPELRGPGGAFHVYERTGALPRAFVVPEAVVVPGDDAVVDALIADDLRPRAQVFVTAKDAEALPLARERGGAATAPAAERTVRFVADEPDHLVLRVGPGAAGYLVLADAALGGWTATVEGVDTPIARGNLFMRVVPVPAQATEVRFRYRPPGFAAGAVLTMLALAVMALRCGSFVRSRPRPARPA